MESTNSPRMGTGVRGDMHRVNRRRFLFAAAAAAGFAAQQTTGAQAFLAGVVPGRPPRPAGSVSTPAAAPSPVPSSPATRLEYFWKNCDECSSLAIRHIEVNTTNTPVAQTYIDRLSEFRDEMSKRGLRLVGLAMYAHLHDSSKLRSMVDDHLLVGRFLQATDGRYISELIAPAEHLGNGDDESYRRVDVKAVIANSNEIGKRVREETGIEIGYHPEQGDIRAGIWDKLVDATDPRYFNFWPDVGHLQACGMDPLPVYRKYRSRMVGCHLRDFAPPADGAGSEGHPRRGRMVPFGEGVIDLPALVRFLRETKFTGCVLGEGGGTRAMRDYMRRTLGLEL